MANETKNDGVIVGEPVMRALAGAESVATGELSELTGFTKLRIRGVLLEFEGLGLVYRTGRARSTRWWLG